MNYSVKGMARLSVDILVVGMAKADSRQVASPASGLAGDLGTTFPVEATVMIFLAWPASRFESRWQSAHAAAGAATG